MQEQKWVQNGWTFLTSSLDQILLIGRKLNTRRGGTLWATLSPDLSLDTSLCFWAAFQNWAEAQISGLALCLHGHFHTLLPSWILTESREGCCERCLSTKGMEKFPSSSEKNRFLLLFELLCKEGRDRYGLQQKVGLMKISAVGVQQDGTFSRLQGCICFHSLW